MGPRLTLSSVCDSPDISAKAGLSKCYLRWVGKKKAKKARAELKRVRAELKKTRGELKRARAALAATTPDVRETGCAPKALLPKTECCGSKSRCTRCPILMLKEGTLPEGMTVRHRRLVGPDGKKVTKKDLTRAA